MEKLVIDMGEINLVVQKVVKEYDEVELAVYLQDKKTDCITQDIATIRQATSDRDMIPSAVECLVWTDDSDDDYTHKFVINSWR